MDEDKREPTSEADSSSSAQAAHLSAHRPTASLSPTDETFLAASLSPPSLSPDLSLDDAAKFSESYSPKEPDD